MTLSYFFSGYRLQYQIPQQTQQDVLRFCEQYGLGINQGHTWQDAINTRVYQIYLQQKYNDQALAVAEADPEYKKIYMQYWSDIIRSF